MRSAKHQGDRVAVLIDVAHSQTGIRRDGGIAAALLKKTGGDAELAVDRLWSSLSADGDPFRYAMAIGSKEEAPKMGAIQGGISAADYIKKNRRVTTS